MKDEILRLRKEGKTYNDISKILNCSKGTISYHCRKLNSNKLLTQSNTDKKNINQIIDVPIIDFGENITEDIIKYVIFYRNRGYSYDKINEKTNLSLDKIKKICRVKGLNDQNKYQERYDKYGFTKDELNDMQIFYDECESSRKVAKKFGCSRYIISKFLIVNKKKPNLDNETLKKNRSKSVVNWRKDKKRKLIEYKGGKCEVCGYDKCVSALSFHHKDPKEKDFNISAKSYSYERLKKEVDKCILVCANCHTEIHDKDKIKNTNCKQKNSTVN